MSLKDLLSQTFENDAPVAESTGGSNVTIKPGEVIFPTQFELNTPNGAVKIDKGRMFLPSLTLLEVTLRLQKPSEFRDNLDGIAWNDPKVMHVLEFQVGVNPLGFEFGLLDPDDSEFISLSDIGDKVAAVYTDRTGASAQTPIIHAQWMRVNPETVERLEGFLRASGYTNAMIGSGSDNTPADVNSGSNSFQQFKWRLSIPVPEHLRSNYGAVMKFQMENGASIDSMVLLKGSGDRSSDFIDFLVNHGRKRDIVYSADVPTATEAQKDNRSRFVSSLTGVYFNGGALGANPTPAQLRSATHVRPNDPKYGRRYEDGSWGRAWPVRPSCREMVIGGEFFSFVPGNGAPAPAPAAVNDSNDPFSA